MRTCRSSTTSSRRCRAGGGLSRRAERGFSMVEGLIAAAIIGFVAIGVIPLFTRAMSDNLAGADYTRVTNYAKTEMEDFTRQPFANFTNSVPNGKTSGQLVEYLDPVSSQWTTNLSTSLGQEYHWVRTTTYSQYDVADLGNPLTGGTAGNSIQLMMVTINVQGSSQFSAAGGRRSTTVRFLKSF
jgi:type II secretory pathway pseudopilin PulG